MLTLNDGRSELWQWDTGRTLAVDADCSQVHFSNKVFGRSIDVDVVDGAAIIPDILLQTGKDLNAWAFVGTAENGYTKISKTFKVNRRNKPADYVFTPTDQTTLDDILDRIEDLEKRLSGGNGGITKEVDPTVPDWAKQPQKPTYTAADVGAIPVPKTATVGQTIVVKAVDETGRPTEWEATDALTGGSAVDDVQINGDSIVNGGVADIKLCSETGVGVAKVSRTYGLKAYPDGAIYINQSSKKGTETRAPIGGSYFGVISSGNIDYAVNAAMCDGKGAVWTDAERIAALLRMGCTVDDNGFVKWAAQEVAK